MTLLLGLVALCAGFLLPGHYPPWVSFEQQALAALGAGLVGAAALTSNGGRPLRLPTIAALVFAVAAIPWVQWLCGQIGFLSDALLSSLYLIGLGLCIVAGATLVATRRADFLDGLGAALITAGLVSTGLAMLQWLGLHWSIFVIDLRPGGRPYANLGQPNHLATLLALSVMATLRAYEQRRMSAPVAALAVAWFGFGMVMTQSRTGWLFVVLLALWWAVMRRRAGLRLPAVAVAAGALAFFSAVLAWDPLNDWLLLSSGTLEARLQTGLRWLHWQTLWDAAWRSPWVGYGWSQVVLAQQAAVLDHRASGEWLLSSHSLLLDLLLWNGIPLGALLAAALVAWFVSRVRACRSVDAWALLAAVGAVFLHAMLEYPLDYAYFLLPLGLLMGASAGLDEQARLWALPRSAFAVSLALMIGMLAWVSLEYLHVQESARQLRFVMARIGIDRVPEAPVPDVVLLDFPREFHRYWLTPAGRGMSPQQLDWMRRVSQRHAIPPAMLRYAMAAGLNGRAQEATDTLARLCKMHPVKRCEEGRDSWRDLQRQYPELGSIAFPTAPPVAAPLGRR